MNITPVSTNDAIVSQNSRNKLVPSKKRQHATAMRKIEIKPSDYVRCAFKANGFKVDDIKIRSNLMFIKPTLEMIDAYTPETLNYVRRNDIEGLKKFHREHRLVNCSNKFGESLLHLACRRGRTEIVRFLIDDVKVDLNIRDDYRRTPVHDACWTTTPNYELVDMLIRKVPEHLLMEDARGFTPFDYIRADHRGKWLRFLWERRAILRPLGDAEEQKKPLLE